MQSSRASLPNPPRPAPRAGSVSEAHLQWLAQRFRGDGPGERAAMAHLAFRLCELALAHVEAAGQEISDGPRELLGRLYETQGDPAATRALPPAGTPDAASSNFSAAGFAVNALRGLLIQPDAASERRTLADLMVRAAWAFATPGERPAVVQARLQRVAAEVLPDVRKASRVRPFAVKPNARRADPAPSEDLFAWGAARAAPALPAPAAPPPEPAVWVGSGVVWPELWKVTKAKQRITVRTPEQFRHDIESRFPYQRRVDPPAVRATPGRAVDGTPFDWPEVEDRALLEELVARGALILVNDSGGKDSQAMAALLARIVPARQLLFVHAVLPEVEWPGTLEHAQMHAMEAGAPFITAESVKTLLGAVSTRFENRPQSPSWPDPANRWCTSHLKSGPIEREVRRYAEENGFSLIVSAEGIRAQESTPRKKSPVWKLHESMLIAPRTVGKGGAQRHLPGRYWLKYHPIHKLSRDQVFDVIAAAGQTPHPAYAIGNERLSCVFCIMGSPGDLRRGAEYNPELFARYDAKERETGWTMFSRRKGGVVEPISLRSVVGFTPEEAMARRKHLPVMQPGSFQLPRGPEVPEEEAACSGFDEWVDEPDEVSLPNARPLTCAAHAGLTRPNHGAAGGWTTRVFLHADPSHNTATREDFGTFDPRKLVALRGGADEARQFARRRSGKKTAAEWRAFVADIAARGVRDPLDVVVDRYGSARLWEGNHRVRAAIEAGRAEVPVRITYLAHADRLGLLLDPETGAFDPDARLPPHEPSGPFTQENAHERSWP